jgi:hypothetical protein
MAVASYTITSPQPISIFPAGLQASKLIRNENLVNHVFLATVASGIGFDLGPGSAITWQAGNPLYANVKAGFPVVITVLDNSGPIFDATAIASQIKVTTAPPLDTQQTLINSTQSVTALAAPFLFSSVDGAGLSCSIKSGQSIIVTVNDDGLFGVPQPRTVEIHWADNLSNEVYMDSFQTVDNSPDGLVFYTAFVCPARTPIFYVLVYSTATTSNVTVHAVASYREITKPSYLMLNGYHNMNGFGSDNYQSIGPESRTFAAPLLRYPHCHSGPGSLTVYADSVATAPLQVALIDAVTLAMTAFITLPILATPQSQTVNFNMGNRVYVLRFNGNGAVVVNESATLASQPY